MSPKPPSNVCLINPPTASPGGAVYLPMGPLVLASYLRERGLPAQLIDFDLPLARDPSLRDWGRFRNHALRQLQGTQAEIFGLSSVCTNFPLTLLLAQEIKTAFPEQKIILGGPQPSALAVLTLERCPWIDLVVLGEGEETLAALVQCAWEPHALAAIPGLVYREAGQVMKGPSRPLIPDLDTLPFPDFSLLPLEEYLSQNPDLALIEAGRGCPFLCSFCSTALMWERQFRVKSPARIHAEMEQLSEQYGLLDFSLTHDNFTTSHRYVDEFSAYFKKHNHQSFSWYASARPDTLNKERIQKLQEAGCRGLYFGIDSGSAEIQKVISKSLELPKVKERFKEAVTCSMPPTASFVVGFPEETEADLGQTLELALWAKLNGAHEIQLSRLSPLAGTKIYEQNKDSLNWERDETDMRLQPIKDECINRWIAGDPELFCSFYSVPTPKLASLNVAACSVFYDELINRMAGAVGRLLRFNHVTPVALFQDWMTWWRAHYPNRLICGEAIHNTFPEFVRYYMWGRRHNDKGYAVVREKPLIFLGPSLHPNQAEEILAADYHPPIRRGDLTRALRDGYRTIGIVDGVFHHDLSVSLQEIREVLESGVRLYGASSMGALRAAEAHPLGMIGVGQVFCWYCDETIKADDEVALCFDESDGHALSEPLVNMRATFIKAEEAGLIDAALYQKLLQTARGIPYPLRCYARLCQDLSSELSVPELNRLDHYFKNSAVDLKRQDALALLERIKADHAYSHPSQELSDRLAAGA